MGNMQAVKHGAKRIRVHVLTDGRDVDDGSSVKYIKRLVGDLDALGKESCDAKVASGGGRMRVTMDRYEVGCRSGMTVCLCDGLL